MKMPLLSQSDAHNAAMEGYCVPKDEEETGTEEAEIESTLLFGDDDKLSGNQKETLLMLNETKVYPRVKIKQISLSFSGAAVFFFSPIRKDGTPMPSSVVKFDTEESVRDEVEKTAAYGKLFGLTTPKVKATHYPRGTDPQDPSALMQIDLCGGMFGLPEFASAPAVHTFASVIQSSFSSRKPENDIVPIINEALERRMCAFTMSGRSVKKVDLAAMYKIIRFVGHGILNRAAEGAKRARKSPALAAGFLTPSDVNDLDSNGSLVQELSGRRETVRDAFERFVSHESRMTDNFCRDVVLGLCHNDLHGGNLLLDSQGLVWLIDFATVKSDVHVLMDVTKFLASCLFLYLEDNVVESNVQMFAKLLAVTPDATTALPQLGGAALKEDAVATRVLEVLSRLRHCACIYEVGDDCPSNDGCPFVLALFSWSSRMLSYSEPSVFQKGRAVFYALACAQRILWETGVEIGSVALDWIEEFRQVWVGQKGRRLSTSATQVQNLAFEFDAEFPRYLAQVGTAEAWSTDFLSREKVHATDHCTAVTVSFSGRIFPRYIAVPRVTTAMLKMMYPINKRYLSVIIDNDKFFGRLVLLGSSGTGKTILTKQLFSETSQQQLISMYGSPDGPAEKHSTGHELSTKIIPLRLPVVDLGRQLQSDPDMSLDADPVSDMLVQWIQRKYGQDSVAEKLVLDVRSANLSIAERRSSLMSSNSTDPTPSVAVDFASAETETLECMGLLLLLDGYDEAADARHLILKYIKSLLKSEPGHVVVLSTRPGSMGGEEIEELSLLGFTSFNMAPLSSVEATAIARTTLLRMGDDDTRINNILKDILLPQYKSLTAVPLVLTLLIHVVRKYQGGNLGDAAVHAKHDDVLKKTEVYQRAVRLILHQSDAAKFALREGRTDQDMVQRLEMLKSPRARKLLQTISWHSHCKMDRAFTWDEVSGVSTDTEAMSMLVQAFEQGRLPILSKDGDEDGMVQFNHLSFQELMAGEYASAIVHYGHSNSTVSTYVNYFLSNSSRSLERDRLSAQWWLQVWMHVCEMLSPGALNQWLGTLAQDEQAKLKQGMTVRCSQISWIPRIWVNLTITELNRPEGFFKSKAHRNECRVNLNLFTPCAGSKPYLSAAKQPLLDMGYPLDGVAGIMRAAVDMCQTGVVQTLTELKVHFSLTTWDNYSAYVNATGSPNRKTLAMFIEMGVVHSDWASALVAGESVWNNWLHAREQGGDTAELLPSTRGRFELARLPKCWLLDQAKQGTLRLGPEVDPNFADPETKLTPLMVAAGCGQAQLVEGLLSRRASVTAESQERCTALTFAAECTAPGTAQCMKMLIKAGADIHHIAGRPLDRSTWKPLLWTAIGDPSRVGKGVCRNGDIEKLGVLLGAGYDINLACGSCHIFNEAVTGGGMEVVDKLLELRIDPTAVPPSIPPDADGLDLELRTEFRPGWTPIVYAVYHWRSDSSYALWRRLLEMKCDHTAYLTSRVSVRDPLQIMSNFGMIRKGDFRALDYAFDELNYNDLLHGGRKMMLLIMKRDVLLHLFKKIDPDAPLIDEGALGQAGKTLKQIADEWPTCFEYRQAYEDWQLMQQANVG